MIVKVLPLSLVEELSRRQRGARVEKHLANHRSESNYEVPKAEVLRKQTSSALAFKLATMGRRRLGHIGIYIYVYIYGCLGMSSVLSMM